MNPPQAATGGELVQAVAAVLRSEGPPGVLIERAMALLGQALGAASVVFTDHEDDEPSVSTIAYEWCGGRLPPLRGRRFVNEDYAHDDSLAASARGQVAFSADVRNDPQLQGPHREAFLALGAEAYYSLPYIANDRIKFALTLLMAQPHAWPDAERALISDAAVRMCTMLERDRALAAMQRSQQQQAELAHTRQALEQARRLSTLGLLLAGVSHELNNPLSIIGIHNALLEDELAGTAMAEHTEAIGRAVQRCQGLVRSYLALARPAAPRLQTVDVPALCQMALDVVAHGLRPAGIHAEVQAAPAAQHWTTDPDQLLQVLVNLVLNAQHAMRDVAPERRRLRLHAQRLAEGDVLGIDVEDGGCGVAAADVPRLFEAFFTTRGSEGGTGLGLALSSRIVAALGGQLGLQHTGPEGSCLRVQLPRQALPGG
jgi:signal transduction histidine kinase